MKNKIIRKKETINIIFIFIVTSLISWPLLKNNIDILRDDGIQHIYRILGNANALKQMNLFPVIMSDFCNEFGYSWNLFYSPFTAYIPLIFKIFTHSNIICLKLFIFSIMFLSGVAMYEFTRKVTDNNKIALIASTFYILSPYHLTDMYQRVAIAELASFVFIPLVFLGMYNIINKNKKDYMLAIGTIGLILSHTVITLYTAIFCFIYCILNIKKIKDKNIIKNLMLNTIIIILTTSFFWIPMLESKNATSYEVFVPGRMERTEILIENKLEFVSLYKTQNKKMVFELGVFIMIAFFITPFAINKINEKYKILYYIFFIFRINKYNSYIKNYSI